MTPQLQLMLQQAIQAFENGNLDSADLMLKRLLQVDSKNLPALHVLGLVKASQGSYKESADYLGRAARLNPNDGSIQYNLAKALMDCGDAKGAIPHHKKAIELNPKNLQAWLNFAETVYYLKRYDEALECCERALQIKPDYYEALNNKGLILHGLKRYDEALEYCERALQIKPDYYEALNNKGLILHDLKRYDEALSLYDQALYIRPDYFDALWNKSLAFLVKGDFNNGLPLYENRWLSEQMQNIAGGLRSFSKPKWLGNESIDGKTILLHGEQGLGDFIQFCRYAKLVSDLGAHVLLETPEPLVSLLANLEGVAEVIIKGKPLPIFDYQTPLLSLPFAFKTSLENIPCPKSYISLNDHPKKLKEWQDKLGRKAKPRIGLVWSGNPNHQNDRNRSLELRQILPYLPNEFEYLSLQKEYRKQDELSLSENPHIINMANQLSSFLDTAALIDCLDLVIAVDTSVAHLSAAMGKETWLLLPYAPDWRWLAEGDKSPWYSTMKLYRQPSIGNWNVPLERIKVNLDRMKFNGI